MKLVEIPYAEAVRRHPNEAAFILAKLRRGTSRHKAAPPDKLTWWYECAVSVQGYTLASVLAGAERADRAARDAMTFEERVADQVARTSTTLNAKIGRWWGGRGIRVNPPEVEVKAREGIARSMREEAEYRLLPQEEKDRRAAEALASLRGTPGFVVLHVPPKGDT